MSAEFQGRWVLRGGIRVPVPDDTPKPKPLPTDPVERELALTEWTDDMLRAAHAAYARGKRDVFTVAGERRYHRARRQARGRMSAEDLRWCESQARAGFWNQWRAWNRRAEINPLQPVAEHLVRASLSNTTRGTTT